MAAKTDMNKAYDCIEWDFLHRVLKANGFSEKASSLIMACVTPVIFSVLLNGTLMTPFNPNCGLRQGDPLFPFLFILCSEVLSKLMLRAEQSRVAMTCGTSKLIVDGSSAGFATVQKGCNAMEDAIMVVDFDTVDNVLEGELETIGLAMKNTQFYGFYFGS
uniref:Reverse transcriptase domain-containing protein n=1 Tax=Cannabis sativa TaxID=3483 RepID=A0A803P6T8_CANSA